MSRQNSQKASDIQLSAENPWPDLHAFDERSATFFHGRSRETLELARLVRRELLSIFFGKSGVGKSSLLRAGLFPLLQPLGFVPVYIRLHYEETGLPAKGQVFTEIERVIKDSDGGIEARLPEDSESLWEYFHRSDTDWWDNKNHLLIPVLVFDQFEEVVTIARGNDLRMQRTDAFLNDLEDLVECHVPEVLQQQLDLDPAGRTAFGEKFDLTKNAFRIILSLREDFLAELEVLRERLRGIMLNRYRLLPMNGEQALEVITKPAPGLVTEEVAFEIIQRVSVSERSQLQPLLTSGQLKNRQVEPTLLSVFCSELNRRRKANQRSQIDISLLPNARSEILTDFYEGALKEMPEPVREFVEDKLLTVTGARNLFPLEDAVHYPKMTQEIVDRLIEKRLIRKAHTTSGTWIELIHDVIADVARTSKRTRQERQKIAAEREAEQEQLRKAEAHAWQAREEAELNAQRLAEAEDNRKRLLRTTVIFAVLAIVAVGAAICAFLFRNQALESEKKLTSSKAGQSDLLYFIQGDVAEKAAKLGQSTIFLDVIKKIGVYFHDFPPDSRDERALRVQALALEQDGDIQLAEKNFAGARGDYQASLAIRNSVVNLSTEVSWQRDRRQDSATCMDRLGNAFKAQHDYGNALQWYLASREIRNDLGQRDPANAQVQLDRSYSYENLGDVSEEQEQHTDAYNNYLESANIRKMLLDTKAGNAQQQKATQLSLSSSYDKMGNVLMAEDKYLDALEFYRKSLAIRSGLVDYDTLDVRLKQNQAYSFQHIGDVLQNLQRLNEALTYLQQYVEILKFLVARDPGDRQRQGNLSRGLERQGDVYEILGKYDEALRNYTDSLKILQDIDPQQSLRSRDISNLMEKRGDVFLKLHNWNQVEDSYGSSCKIRQRLAAASPLDADLQRNFTSSIDRYGTFLLAQRKFDEALSSFNDSLQRRLGYARLYPNDTSWQDFLAFSYEHVGDVYFAQGNPIDVQRANLNEALAEYRQAYRIRQRLTELDHRRTDWQEHFAGLCLKVSQVLDTRLDANKKEATQLVRQGANILESLSAKGELSEAQKQICNDLRCWAAVPNGAK